MRCRCLVLALLALLLAGCGGQKHSIIGWWKTGGSEGVLVFEESGVLSTALGSQLDKVGTWKLDGDDLTLYNSLLSTPGQPVLYTRMHLKWLSNDKVEVDMEEIAGGKVAENPSDPHVYTMERLSSEMQAELMRGGNTKQSDVDNPLLNGGSESTTESDICFNNLKHLAMGALLYASDYDDAMPPPFTWDSGIKPYIKDLSVMDCPTVVKQGGKGGYALNSLLAGAPLRAQSSPATSPMFYETDNLTEGATEEPSHGLTVARHDGKICVAYADGHVKKLEPGEKP